MLMGAYLFAPEEKNTPTFTLRSYRPGDGEMLAAAKSTSYDHLQEFMDWATEVVNPHLEEQRARTLRGKYLLSVDFTLAIVSPEGDRLMGGCGYHLRHGGAHSKCAEVGMWIAAEEAGKGLGTRVLEELLAWGFTEWPWRRLVWRCDARNLASARLAEKVGMKKEGVSRQERVDHHGVVVDMVTYSILREEWEALHRAASS